MNKPTTFQTISLEKQSRILEKVKKSDEINNITHYGLTIARNLLMDFFRKRVVQTTLKWLCPEKSNIQQSWIIELFILRIQLLKEPSLTIQSAMRKQHCKSFWNRNAGKTFWAVSEVFTLSTYKGMTAKLIAEQLGESQNTVLGWMTKAKKEFIKCYWGEEADA